MDENPYKAPQSLDLTPPKRLNRLTVVYLFGVFLFVVTLALLLAYYSRPVVRDAAREMNYFKGHHYRKVVREELSGPA